MEVWLVVQPGLEDLAGVLEVKGIVFARLLLSVIGKRRQFLVVFLFLGLQNAFSELIGLVRLVLFVTVRKIGCHFALDLA